MSFYEQLNVESQREQKPLEAGTYGTKKVAGLKIVKYIDKSSKPTEKDPALFRHSMLVAALGPNKQQLEAEAAAKKNGSTNPLAEPDHEGTAFFSLNLKQEWLNPVAIAFGFSGKEVDLVAAGVSRGDFSQEQADAYKADIQKQAVDKVVAANTPAEAMDEAVVKAYESILTQIRINVGTLFRLQDWKGVPRNPDMDLHELVGTEFSGTIRPSNLSGSVNTEVGFITAKEK